MAMFKAFKPSGMEKIARAMGYSGNMQGFQDYLAQDPMRQQQMQTYQNKAMQMAKGGYARKKYQEGGIVTDPNSKFYGQPAPQGLMSTAPNYQDFLQSDIYKQQVMGDGLIGVAAPAVLDPVQVGGQTYGFANPVIGQAYRDYMASIGQNTGVGKSSGPTTGKQFDEPLKFEQVAQPMSSPYGAGFRQPGDMGRYIAFNDPGQPGAGFANAAEYEAAQQQTTPPASPTQQPSNVTEATIQRMYQPGLPTGGVTQAALTPSEAGQYIQPGMGTVTGAVSVPTAMAGVAGVAPVQETAAAQMQAATAAPAVNAAMQATQAAQGTVDPRAQVTAAQQTATSVGNLSAAQGNATLIDNPVQREIQAGELISGSADAAKAAQFTEQIQAAQATPSQQATVQGQLANLTANFDATNPPAWAAGALRNATAKMAARGLGASSLAGQAIVQATLEAALPIAQADAATVAQFEAQNLSNRQQRAMLAAQQRAEFMGMEFTQDFQARVQNAARISDIANQNFTAEQQVQLENSRIANTMNLNNLSNRQALVMAEAAALAQMDTQNLNNRQQAAVQNAQSFLNMDMANLSNRQQTDLFKAQQRVQSMFTDQAATNAAAQFNASSQNQVDQFFANLSAQTSQFNAAQANAQSQFNAGQANTVERFNAELNNQRDQFNAQNQLAIAQSNAVWRREIATADTAAVNRVNEINANNLLAISNQAYANLWNYYADTMEWAWTSAENAVDRINALAIAELDADSRKAIAAEEASGAAGSAIGSLIGTLGSAWIMSTCWVAREVYGKENVEWFVFRTWMQYEAPRWFFNLYKKHGESFAKFISNKPKLKSLVKFGMDYVVNKKKRKHNVSCA